MPVQQQNLERVSLALNAMQTMVDDIGAKSNSAVVLALVRGPTDTPRSVSIDCLRDELYKNSRVSFHC